MINCCDYYCNSPTLDPALPLVCMCRELSKYVRDASFPEKKNYDPKVKIEYVDDSGRLLNTKEVRLEKIVGGGMQHL